MKKNKFEYKRVDERMKISDVNKFIEKQTEDNWEIFWYFEDVMSNTQILIRLVLKRPRKKTILIDK